MPVPKGYTLDTPPAKLPAGYTRDSATDLNMPPVPGAPIPAALQGPPDQPSTMSHAVDAVTNFGKGLVKGGASTFLNIAQKGNDLREWEHKNLPASLSGAAFIPHRDQENRQYVQDLQNRTQTNGLAQALGKGTEQVGEFMLPGLGEEAATAKLASAGPKAAAAARMLYGAATSGAINKAQGGSFSGGALAGGLGSGVSEGLKAVAPIIAESALGIRAPDRAFGRTPGRAILDETTGLNAGKIAQQASQKLNLYGTQLEDAAARSPSMVDLTASRQAAADAEATALLRNNPDVVRRTGQISSQLNRDLANAGAVLPAQVTPTRALAIKRGIGDLKGSWNPATSNSFVDGTVGRVYGTLDHGIDAAVPSSEGLNRKMASLMPVSARAAATDLNAGAIQQIMSKLTRPTGALAATATGAYAGHAAGGAPGAIMGGLGALVLPHLIASPTAQMAISRGANSALVPPVVKALTGSGLQSTRKKNLYGKD